MQRCRHLTLDHGLWRCCVLLFLISVSCVACGRSQAEGISPTSTPAPIIDELEPSSGWAGEAYPITVTIKGRHFAESDNQVSFGSMEIAAPVSSTGGTKIVFSIPKSAPAVGEVPPMELQPGAYEVRVTTAHGMSDPFVFTLTLPGSR